jgi:hypothetical protein
VLRRIRPPHPKVCTPCTIIGLGVCTAQKEAVAAFQSNERLSQGKRPLPLYDPVPMRYRGNGTRSSRCPPTSRGHFYKCHLLQRGHIIDRQLSLTGLPEPNPCTEHYLREIHNDHTL